MRRKSKDSNFNVALTATLVVFVCLLSFSVGVISGKGWSDREYKIRHIEQDSHVQAAKQDDQPLGDEMTQREVEMLTQRALQEAQAEAPAEQPAEQDMEMAIEKIDDKAASKPSADNKPASPSEDLSTAMEDKEKVVVEKVAKTEKKAKRKISSIPKKPTTPAPTSIEYTVQVAAYKTIAEAEAHAQRLIDKGFPAFPVKALIKGSDWYRVSIGSFKNRKQAINYEKALKKQSVVKSTFVRKITRRKTQ